MPEKKRMKPVTAWALVWNDGDMYGPDEEGFFARRQSARAALRGFKGIVTGDGKFVERIARVCITEVK